jgi:hypothetical protein
MRSSQGQNEGGSTKYDILHMGDFKKVALLDLTTGNPSLYGPGVFGEAAIQPILSSAGEMAVQLQGQIDLILPTAYPGIATV